MFQLIIDVVTWHLGVELVIFFACVILGVKFALLRSLWTLRARGGHAPGNFAPAERGFRHALRHNPFNSSPFSGEDGTPWRRCGGSGIGSGKHFNVLRGRCALRAAFCCWAAQGPSNRCYVMSDSDLE